MRVNAAGVLRSHEEPLAFLLALIDERQDRVNCLPVWTELSKAGNFQRLFSFEGARPERIVVACLYPTLPEEKRRPREIGVYGAVRTREARGLPLPIKSAGYQDVLKGFRAFERCVLEDDGLRAFWARGRHEPSGPGDEVDAGKLAG